MSGPVNSIQIFSTCPQSSAVSKNDYLSRVIDVARWSEACDCEGILVYADNSLIDPWLVAETIACNTAKLCPLVAVQPIYMHPYSVAKMVSSIAYLHGRRLYLNMVAGGFKNDLAALNDTTPHDMRYARLVEYTTVIKQLLGSPNPVTFRGQFYAVTNLKLEPPCPKNLQPGVFVSGSSDAGLAACHALGAIAVQYPKRASECDFIDRESGCQYGVRVGIIARPSPNEAWAIAHDRFPDDRKGELAHQLAMKTSDSVWHHQLSELGRYNRENQGAYWMRPFETYKTFCPYLVGGYQDVAAELSEYHRRGYTKFILDIPPCERELQHISTVFNMVAQSTIA